MKILDLKNLLIRSLDKDNDPDTISKEIEEAGVTYRFREGFSDKVLERIYSARSVVVREVELVRNMNTVFYRIALSGAAAIILLLISIFILQGSLSLDSFLGLGNVHDESIICLLTGN